MKLKLNPAFAGVFQQSDTDGSITPGKGWTSLLESKWAIGTARCVIPVDDSLFQQSGGLDERRVVPSTND